MFLLPPGSLPLPFFPIDGILTRMIQMVPSGDHAPAAAGWKLIDIEPWVKGPERWSNLRYPRGHLGYSSPHRPPSSWLQSARPGQRTRGKGTPVPQRGSGSAPRYDICAFPRVRGEVPGIRLLRTHGGGKWVSMSKFMISGQRHRRLMLATLSSKGDFRGV
jgi:hypothetical protein